MNCLHNRLDQSFGDFSLNLAHVMLLANPENFEAEYMTKLHYRKFPGAGADSNIGHLSHAFGADDLLLSVQQLSRGLSSYFNMQSHEDNKETSSSPTLKSQQFGVGKVRYPTGKKQPRNALTIPSVRNPEELSIQRRSYLGWCKAPNNLSVSRMYVLCKPSHDMSSQNGCKNFDLQLNKPDSGESSLACVVIFRCR